MHNAPATDFSISSTVMHVAMHMFYFKLQKYFVQKQSKKKQMTLFLNQHGMKCTAEMIKNSHATADEPHVNWNLLMQTN